MILKCVDCGYIKNVYEEDLMDNTSCEICGGAMLLKKDIDKLEETEKDNAVGDNYPAIPNNDNEITLRMAEQEVKNNINILGEVHTWYLIEALADVELRIRYRQVFFKLGAKMPEKESLK